MIYDGGCRIPRAHGPQTGRCVVSCGQFVRARAGDRGPVEGQGIQAPALIGDGALVGYETGEGLGPLSSRERQRGVEELGAQGPTDPWPLPLVRTLPKAQVHSVQRALVPRWPSCQMWKGHPTWMDALAL
jgi:hypothetical protein